uniref:Putative ribonuclease H-like domain-containing protein n=1 Tax=Tanacetum cinerariifolium TaxID=118510 RepID=A0A6L2MS37_TANCI|nr:putative ribonuclease H-like domain-containing protein [Tanacetum cinerariifolium]
MILKEKLLSIMKLNWFFIMHYLKRKESINSGFARFNTIITSLKALDEGFSSKNYVRKFLRALYPKWRAKVTTIEESKYLSSLALDELIGNLKVHEVVMEKDFKFYRGKNERDKSIALKAKKESSDDETSTSESDDEEYVMAVRNFKKFFRINGKFVRQPREEKKSFRQRCCDPNHLIEECSKPPKDKNQRAFVEGSWSDSSEEDDEKVNNETCLVAQASSEMIDYSLWEVIKNSATLLKTQVMESVTTVMPITTIEEKAQRRLEVKARSTLMMGIPNEHQLKFNFIKDAKQLLEAVEKRFGGNAATKKTQMNLLKQHYENFIASSLEMLDQTFGRLQKLVSQLELLAGLDTMSMDDNYNNIKVYEPKVKGMSSSSSSTQNMAFMSSSNNNSSSTNGTVNNVQAVNTARVSTTSTQVNGAYSINIDNLGDVVICSFFASQPSSHQLVHEDLEQIYPDDMDEMDLRWQMAMLSMRARMECRAPRNQDNQHKENSIRSMHVETSASTALVSYDGLGGYDWSDQAEEGPNYALMAFSSSSFDSNVSNDSTCLKSCLETIKLLKSQNEQLLKDLKKSELMVLDEFANKHVAENNKSSEEEPKVVRKNDDAPIIKEWVSDDEEENATQPKIEKKHLGLTLLRKNHLGKFDVKADESFFVGYTLNSKAFRVFNSRTRIVEENLHIRFSENTPNVVVGTQSNGFADTKQVIMQSSHDDGSKTSSNDAKKFDEDPRKENECNDQEKEDNVNNTNNFNTVSLAFNVAGINEDNELLFDPNMPALEDISIFNSLNDDEDDGIVADMNNLDTTIQVSPTPTTRTYKDHLLDQVIRDLQTSIQTRKMSKNLEEHGFVSTIQQRTNNKDLQNYLFACFLSQEEPKKALNGFSRIKKDERGIVKRNKARLVAQGHTQEERIDYDEVFSPVTRIEAIRLFLAYASFKDFVVYQMDVKSAFLYEEIEEEVYVCQPPVFEDLDFPDRVYKVEKALYGLHQAPRAWYETLSTYLLDNGFQRWKIDKTLFIKRYLKGQPKLGLWYLKDSPFDLVAYTDNDYAGASLDRKSTIGGCQFLGCRLISWQCKKQTVVANFIIEAGYVVASNCCSFGFKINHLIMAEVSAASEL